MEFYNSHEASKYMTFHTALLDVVGLMNSPHADKFFIKETGLSLDSALFPLIILIKKNAPVTLMELSEKLNRDGVLTRRHIARLESLGYVESGYVLQDRREKGFSLTDDGKIIVSKIDYTREYIFDVIFEGWSEERINSFAKDLQQYSSAVHRFISEKK